MPHRHFSSHSGYLLKNDKGKIVIQLQTIFTVIPSNPPLFPLVFILKPIKNLFNQPELLGPCFLVTALVLFAGCCFRFPLLSTPPQRTWKDPLTIGLFQAMAIFPGISRSGSTISAALLLSWPREQAIQFSFFIGNTCYFRGNPIRGLASLEISWRFQARKSSP